MTRLTNYQKLKREKSFYIMCNCISYNRPDLGGSDKEVILIPPEFIGKSTVCIDSCMVPIILKL